MTTKSHRSSWSLEEMVEAAKEYMQDTYGPCKQSKDWDRWNERLGILIDFVYSLFPSNITMQEPSLEQIEERLKYLRQEIEAERISMGELVELESLTGYIDPGDVVLLEWAGVLERSS